MKESSFQTNVIHFLNTLGVYVIKIWGGGFQSAGVPDLVICANGKFIGLELKVDDNKASEIQTYHLEEINSAGGVAFVFRHSVNWKIDLHTFINMVMNNEKEGYPASFELPKREKSIT